MTNTIGIIWRQYDVTLPTHFATFSRFSFVETGSRNGLTSRQKSPKFAFYPNFRTSEHVLPKEIGTRTLIS